MISHCVWLYFLFVLSFMYVDLMMSEWSVFFKSITMEEVKVLVGNIIPHLLFKVVLRYWIQLWKRCVKRTPCACL